MIVDQSKLRFPDSARPFVRPCAGGTEGPPPSARPTSDTDDGVAPTIPLVSPPVLLSRVFPGL